MKQYLDLLRHIKENGVEKSDRTKWLCLKLVKE